MSRGNYSSVDPATGRMYEACHVDMVEVRVYNDSPDTYHFSIDEEIRPLLERRPVDAEQLEAELKSTLAPFVGTVADPSTLYEVALALRTTVKRFLATT